MKRSYEKVKQREDLGIAKSSYPRNVDEEGASKDEAAEPAGLKLHPERQAMLDAPSSQQRSRPGQDGTALGAHARTRKPKPSPFARETALAEKRKADLNAKRQAIEQREKERRAMAKARKPDKDGKIKLGRQSKVLLDRVRRLVEE